MGKNVPVLVIVVSLGKPATAFAKFATIVSPKTKTLSLSVKTRFDVVVFANRHLESEALFFVTCTRRDVAIVKRAITSVHHTKRCDVEKPNRMRSETEVFGECTVRFPHKLLIILANDGVVKRTCLAERVDVFDGSHKRDNMKQNLWGKFLELHIFGSERKEENVLLEHRFLSSEITKYFVK